MRMAPHWGVGSKLIALALANVLALAMLTAVVWLAYGRIEDLSTEIASKELSRIVDNAALGRGVSSALSESDAAIRGCQDPSGSSDRNGQIHARLAEIAASASDPVLQASLMSLAATTHRLLTRCGEIGVTLGALAASDQYLLEQLAVLEKLTSRALINQTLAGKSTDYLDQVMALATGYRESIMLIDRQIGRGSMGAELKQPPILAVTANAFAEDREACIAASMNEHLSKPVDPDILYEVLLRLVGKRDD